VALRCDPARRIHNPDHPLGILPAVFFQLPPNPQKLGLRHIAEVNAQVFATTRGLNERMKSFSSTPAFPGVVG